MVEDELLTVNEAAERLRVHPESVRRWLRAGELRGYLISTRAGWRIPRSEVERFLTRNAPDTKLAA